MLTRADLFGAMWKTDVFCQQENCVMSDLSIARREIFSRNEFRYQILRLVKNWKIRRRVRALLDQEEVILEDIGVERAEVYWASRLPLTINSAIALQDRSVRRRQRIKLA
jgi:uncharacterized protein YjiS (DUF1127 family)